MQQTEKLRTLLLDSESYGTGCKGASAAKDGPGAGARKGLPRLLCAGDVSGLGAANVETINTNSTGANCGSFHMPGITTQPSANLMCLSSTQDAGCVLMALPLQNALQL